VTTTETTKTPQPVTLVPLANIPVGARRPPYQLLDKLKPEEEAALTKDIAERGVLIPVEVDEDGNILDGHHRAAIADKLGISYETETRHFETEEKKREHVLKINLFRRHLEPLEWGLAFKTLCQVRGVSLGTKGGRPKKDENRDTVTQFSKELGVTPRTAQRRVALADAYEALPAGEKDQVDAGQRSVRKAKTDAADAEGARVLSGNEEIAREALERAAKAFGVSTRLVEDAKKIKKEDPAMFEKIKAGKITITRAKREMKANRVFRNFIEGLEAFAPSCENLDLSQVSPSALREYIPIMKGVLKVLQEIQQQAAEKLLADEAG
jgi:ParB-like chromosome segregation protein Spo0J